MDTSTANPARGGGRGRANRRFFPTRRNPAQSNNRNVKNVTDPAENYQHQQVRNNSRYPGKFVRGPPLVNARPPQGFFRRPPGGPPLPQQRQQRLIQPNRALTFYPRPRPMGFPAAGPRYNHPRFPNQQHQQHQQFRGPRYLPPRRDNYYGNRQKKTVTIVEPVKPDEETIKKVKADILSCILARKEVGIPPDCLRNAYSTAVGKDVPVDEIGYKSLFQLVRDIPQVMQQKNPQGHVVLVAEKYANKRTKLTRLIQEASKKLEKDGTAKTLSPLSRKLRKIRHVTIAKTPKKVAKKTSASTTVAAKKVTTVVVKAPSGNYTPKITAKPIGKRARATLSNKAASINAKLPIIQPRSVKYVARKAA